MSVLAVGLEAHYKSTVGCGSLPVIVFKGLVVNRCIACAGELTRVAMTLTSNSLVLWRMACLGLNRIRARFIWNKSGSIRFQFGLAQHIGWSNFKFGLDLGLD